MNEPRPYHMLDVEERRLLERVRLALESQSRTIEQLCAADAVGDRATIRRLAPQLLPIIAVADQAWPTLFPEVDKTTVSHGERLGVVLGYLTALAEARLRSLDAVSPATPPVA